METKTIKTDSTVTGITENYLNALDSIKNKIETNNYVLKINGVETTTLELGKINLDMSNLSHSGRKKVAKRLWNYKKKGTIRSINLLFYVLNKMNVIESKVKVEISHKEAEINLLRAKYVKLRAEAEQARLFYKETKGNFYKK